MLDIREGDILVVGTKEYPIKSCGEWTDGRMNSIGFRHMANLKCSTKRVPAISGGKRGAPAAKLTGLKCTPLDPYAPDLQEREALKTPHEILQTFVGDETGFVHLKLEQLKNPPS